MRFACASRGLPAALERFHVDRMGPVLIEIVRKVLRTVKLWYGTRKLEEKDHNVEGRTDFPKEN